MRLIMLKRKLTEAGSAIYRNLCFPFVRMHLERKTKSILKQKSYLRDHSVLAGRNYVGKGAVLNHTVLGFGSQINDRGYFTNTRIGKYTSIGTDVKTAIGTHPLNEHAALHTAFYDASAPLGFTYVKETTFEPDDFTDKEAGIQIEIGNDVWIGNGVQILSGVTIGDGAVVGCGAVVTKDLKPYGIYAGVPAKLIRKRYDDVTIEALLNMKWWEKGEDWIRTNIAKFSDVKELTGIK